MFTVLTLAFFNHKLLLQTFWTKSPTRMPESVWTVQFFQMSKT